MASLRGLPRSCRVQAALLGFVLTSALILPACGGGGSSGGALPEPPLNAQQIVQDILTECVQSSVDDVLALQALIEASIAGGGTGPDATVTGIDLSSLSRPGVTFVADVDGDTVADTTGRVSLLNPPLALLLQLSELAAGGGDPEAVLAALPDGTTVEVDFISTTTLTASGLATLRLANPTGTQAVPDRTSGAITTNDGACDVLYTWQDQAFEQLLPSAGGYPTGEVNFAVDAPAGDVSGTIEFDGTNVAVVSTTLNPYDAHHTFFLDIETGIVTPILP